MRLLNTFSICLSEMVILFQLNRFYSKHLVVEETILFSHLADRFALLVSLISSLTIVSIRLLIASASAS